ncbi:hypothetical protein AAG906_020652 [Vitis piasezkii]
MAAFLTNFFLPVHSFFIHETGLFMQKLLKYQTIWKSKIIKSLVRSQSFDIVCLQETKSNQMSTQLGMARGAFVVFWNNRALDLIETEVGIFSISHQFKCCDDNFVWMLTGVYGPVDGSERETLWAELGDIRWPWDDPCFVGGEFNVVRFPGERRNCSKFSTSMRCFSEIIEDLTLRNLSFRRLGRPLQ